MISIVDVVVTKTVASYIVLTPLSTSSGPQPSNSNPFDPIPSITSTSRSVPTFHNPFASTSKSNSFLSNPFAPSSSTHFSNETLLLPTTNSSSSTTSTTIASNPRNGTSTPVSTDKSARQVTWPVIVGPLLGFGAIIILIVAVIIWYRRRSFSDNITLSSTRHDSRLHDFKNRIFAWRNRNDQEEHLPPDDEKQPLRPPLTWSTHMSKRGVPRHVPAGSRPDPIYEMGLRRPEPTASTSEGTHFFNPTINAQRTNGGFEVRRNIRPSYYYIEGAWDSSNRYP